jgi:outer membrane lipoprotein LolB
MNHHYPFLLTISLACMLLASCATMSPDDELSDEEKQPLDMSEPSNWAAEKQKRQQIQDWEIRGRLGVQTKTDGGSMDIIWKQSGAEYSIRLIAPMAAGTYHILGANDYAEIRYPDGSKASVENADDVFLTSLKVDLPTTAIKDWVRGLPASELPVDHIKWNELGLIERVKQSGWNVEMSRYTGSDLLMPHAIYISRDDDEDIDIRLVLRQWLLDY